MGRGFQWFPGKLGGRKGKQVDGSSRSREVKLGCVFTQTAADAKGHPIRTVGKIIMETQRKLPMDGERRKMAEKHIGYFSSNAFRMRYGEFRAQGLFVGSGVVEAGCKTVIGKRLKQSGMQ